MSSNYKYFVFTGPESSGKTTLSEWVSATFDLPLVPEYARYFLENLDRPYKKDDLNFISKGQLAYEIGRLDKSTIICDTDLLNIIIWYEVKYKNIPAWLLDWFRNTENRLYFICHPDIPWEYDPLRENPADRQFLLERHQHYLTKFNKNFINLSGALEERQEKLKIIFRQIV